VLRASNIKFFLVDPKNSFNKLNVFEPVSFVSNIILN